MNGQTARRDASAVRVHEKHLRDALQVLERARGHALLPTDHIVTVRPWIPVGVAAWKIARDNGAAGCLSAGEQTTFELANWDAETFNAGNIAAMAAIGRAAMGLNVDVLDRNAPLPSVERSVYFGENRDAAAEESYLLRSVGVTRIARLTAAQIEQLEQSIHSAIDDGEILLNDCRHVTSQAEAIPKHVRAD